MCIIMSHLEMFSNSQQFSSCCFAYDSEFWCHVVICSKPFSSCCFAYDSAFWCHIIICSKPYFMFICINDIVVALWSLCSCRSEKYKEENIVSKTDHIENNLYLERKQTGLLTLYTLINRLIATVKHMCVSDINILICSHLYMSRRILMMLCLIMGGFL